jgi:hypothetical protein
MVFHKLLVVAITYYILDKTNYFIVPHRDTQNWSRIKEMDRHDDLLVCYLGLAFGYHL